MTAIAIIIAYLIGFSFWLGVCRGRRDPWLDALLFASFWPLGAAWHKAKFGRIAVLLLLAAALPARAAYVKTILEDPLHPPMSAGVTFDSHMNVNGGATMVAPIYHPSDPTESLIPQRLLDLGVKPVAWAVNIGIGGTPDNFVIPFGFSANLTPTVLGPALDAMKKADNIVLRTVGNAVDGPNGGIAFGPQWTAHLMRDRVILPVNTWRFPPGWFVGGLWKFGAAK